jgi:hypothetical protein
MTRWTRGVLRQLKTLRGRFASVPERDVPFELILERDVPNVVLSYIAPGMLNTDDRQIYYQVARDLYKFQGSIVDLGTFLGGTSCALVCGLIDNPLLSPTNLLQAIVHAYDLFEYNFSTQESLNSLLKDDDLLYEGESYYSEFKRLMGPFMSFVRSHIGDICNVTYDDERPIEVLGVDICKSRETTNAVFCRFFPRLMQGGYVLHQDFLHTWHPQICVAMGYFADHFQVVHELDIGQTVLFRVTKPIMPEQMPEFSNVLMRAKEDWLPLFDRGISQIRKPRSLNWLKTTRTLCIAEAEEENSAKAYAQSVRGSLTDSLICSYLDQVLDYIDRGMPPPPKGPPRPLIIQKDLQ